MRPRHGGGRRRCRDAASLHARSGVCGWLDYEGMTTAGAAHFCTALSEPLLVKPELGLALFAGDDHRCRLEAPSARGTRHASSPGGLHGMHMPYSIVTFGRPCRGVNYRSGRTLSLLAAKQRHDPCSARAWLAMDSPPSGRPQEAPISRVSLLVHCSPDASFGVLWAARGQGRCHGKSK